MELKTLIDWIKQLSGAATDNPESSAQISSDIALFIFGSAAAALGTLALGFIAWWLITRHQLRADDEARKIERLRLLHELDETFDQLSAQKCVYLGESYKEFSADGSACYIFETILTKKFKWYFNLPNNPGVDREYTWQDGQRMAPFLADDESIVSTHSLHRFINWFRRLYRGYQQGLVTDEDLYSMWRRVLPFTTDGRFTYLNCFFGVTRTYGNKEKIFVSDIEALAFISREIIKYCLKNNIREPLDYLGARPEEDDRCIGRIDKILYEAFFDESSPIYIREEREIDKTAIEFDFFDPSQRETLPPHPPINVPSLQATLNKES